MKGIVGFGVSAAAMLIAAASQYATIQTLADIDRRVTQTNLVLAEADAQLTALREVESASRGYAATGDERFLAQVVAGSTEARSRMASLRRLAQPNARELQILDRLEANVQRMLASADEVVGARQSQGSSAAGEAIRESVRLKLMIETLNLLDWMKDEENALIQSTVAEGQRAARLAGLLTGIVTVFAFILIGVGIASIRARRAAESQLRAEKEFNAVALESLHDGIVTCDAQGDAVKLNRAARALPAEPAKLPLARALAGERLRDLELHLGERYVLVSGQPVFSSAQGKLGAILSLHDITERKHAEDELRRSEARYRSVITAMAEGVVIHNAEGAIVACNASATRILRLTEDQLTGRFSTDPHWSAIREDGSPFPGHDHPAMVALRTGQSIVNVRMGLVNPDGSTTWLSINAEPVAEPPGVVATFVDITASKHAEDSLREREAELREAQRLAGVGSWSWNISSGEIRWSEELCRILGHDPAQPAPSYSAQQSYFTPESWSRLDAAVRDTMKSGQPYELELTLANGRDTLVTRGEAVHDGNGKLIRLRGTAGRLK
jgi:PAS domain S-box-containing protein